jgi:hypothetical protein
LEEEEDEGVGEGVRSIRTVTLFSGREEVSSTSINLLGESYDSISILRTSDRYVGWGKQGEMSRKMVFIDQGFKISKTNS